MFKQRIINIYYSRRLLWQMACIQLKSRYAGSFLGIWLVIVNQLILVLAITFVFKIILKIEIKDFPLFVLSGIFPWMFFSSTLFEVTSVFLSQQNVLRQFNFPREIIPLSSIICNFLNFLIGWVIVYPVFCFLNPGILFLLPLLIAVLLLHLLMVCGLGLILSVMNVFFRDIGHILSILFMFWFWITPIFYSVDMVPKNLRWVYNLNPAAPYIEYYRDITLKGSVPDLSVFIAVFFWSFFSLFLGFWVFCRLESKILKSI